MTYTEFLGYLAGRLMVQVLLTLMLSVVVGGITGAFFEARQGRRGTAVAAGRGALLAAFALAASPFVSIPRLLEQSRIRLPPPTASSTSGFSGGLSFEQVLHLILSLTLASAVGAVLGSTVARKTLRRLPEATFSRLVAALVVLMAAMLVVGYFLDCHGRHDPALCR
jgi:uncharacterized membrane protein YfcA